jgi:hypothetical protein
MPYQISQRPDYLRGVIGNSATADEFAAFYRELQLRCAELGLERALVVVVPGDEVPRHEDLGGFHTAGFVDGFRLALVCATWTLYQACNKAERAASRAGFQVRTFLQEMEGVNWLSNGPS